MSLLVVIAEQSSSSPFLESSQVTVPGTLLSYYMKQSRINQAKQEAENTRLREELRVTNEINELQNQLARVGKK